MSRWRGRWLLGVAGLHTLFAVFMFGDALRTIWARGVFNSIREDLLLGAVSWFLLFGFCLACLGLAIDQLERVGQRSRVVGVGALLMILLGIFLMPASGFWLGLPPALSLLRS